jgi:hypothetical protein
MLSSRSVLGYQDLLDFVNCSLFFQMSWFETWNTFGIICCTYFELHLYVAILAQVERIASMEVSSLRFSAKAPHVARRVAPGGSHLHFGESPRVVWCIAPCG